MLSPLKFFRLDPNAVPPSRLSPADAGYDLSSCINIVVPARGHRLVETGVGFHLPLNTYGRIAPRSGLALFNKIDIGGGVVDQSYEGSVKVIVFNRGDSDFEIRIGDRIAQFIVELPRKSQRVDSRVKES
jgi:dUTP pyrophosphatase